MLEAPDIEEGSFDGAAAAVSVGDVIDDWLSVRATDLDVFDAFLALGDAGDVVFGAGASAAFADLPPKKLSACAEEFSTLDSGLPFSGGGDGLFCSMVDNGYVLKAGMAVMVQGATKRCDSAEAARWLSKLDKGCKCSFLYLWKNVRDPCGAFSEDRG